VASVSKTAAQYNGAPYLQESKKRADLVKSTLRRAITLDFYTPM
jgi:hypothetical protein